MTLEVGQPLPDVAVKSPTADGIEEVRTADLAAGKTLVLFAVPGAFTPTCSDAHLPGFVTRFDDLREAGADAVACVAVNDAFVMGAWGKATGADAYLTLLADGNAALASAMGLELDASGFGMGTRSRRYAAVVDDGTIVYLGVEPAGEVGVSSAEAVLEFLRAR